MIPVKQHSKILICHRPEYTCIELVENCPLSRTKPKAEQQLTRETREILTQLRITCKIAESTKAYLIPALYMEPATRSWAPPAPVTK